MKEKAHAVRANSGVRSHHVQVGHRKTRFLTHRHEPAIADERVDFRGSVCSGVRVIDA